MTKEKFTYELIDKWLILISQHSVLLENFTQRDRTNTYIRCTEKLEECFSYYDQLYEKVDCNVYTEDLIDARLEYLIQRLRTETIKNILSEIETTVCIHIDNKKEFIEKYLLQDTNGKNRELCGNALVCFAAELRKREERME